MEIPRHLSFPAAFCLDTDGRQEPTTAEAMARRERVVDLTKRRLLCLLAGCWRELNIALGSMRDGIVVVDDDGRNVTAGVQNTENDQPSVILAEVDAIIAENAQS
jgi:hypothetical protein